MIKHKSAYQRLEQKFERLYQLRHLCSMAHWDMATMMPSGGSEARANALAEVNLMMNNLLSETETADLIHAAEADKDNLSAWQLANLREMKRKWQNATSVYSQLIKEKTLAGSQCEIAWRSLRAENNWSDFQPLLEQVIKLTIEEAQQRSEGLGLKPYDALLNLYEPGQSSTAIDKIFVQLKEFLPEFIIQVEAMQAEETVIPLVGSFAIEQQKQLGLKLMRQVGFDFNHGRLDVSHHPFCGGVPEDVRITTRYSEQNFTESLMGVLHETGHAKYEQGLPADWLSQPVGEARGMGIHESQSLFQEMQVARSRAFIAYAAPHICKVLAPQEQKHEQQWSAENLYLLNNRVKPDYIRINADEVTYPLHVILRYEIEKDLIEQKITVSDLPDVWDNKMQQYLGLSTRGNYKDGCMQDIHWTDGSLGYFPTYTLGAMNAAQIYHAVKQSIPDLQQQISQGDFDALNQWQRTHIWSQGSFYSIDELMQHATGETLQAEYFITHLNSRYLQND